MSPRFWWAEPDDDPARPGPTSAEIDLMEVYRTLLDVERNLQRRIDDIGVRLDGVNAQLRRQRHGLTDGNPAAEPYISPPVDRFDVDEVPF